MTALRLGLLGAAVAGAVLRPRRVPVWVAPAALVVAAVAIGAVHPDDAARSLRPLLAPLLFLLLAVPLGVLLDEVGFFAATATRIDSFHHLELALWLFGAAVTTFLNLDAAVVLLTPLYIGIARRHRLDPTALAFQPVLLALVASSALPVSNLTNLLVAERLDLSVGDFVVHLGPPSIAAIVVGYLGWRWVFPRREAAGPAEPISTHTQQDPRAFRLGIPIVAFLLAGFTAGDLVGIPAWCVALVAVASLAAVTRHLPWRSVPVDAALLVTGLGILAAAAGPALRLDRWLDRVHPSTASVAATIGVAAVAANLVNNLPALLATLPALHAGRSSLVWPVLLGVNMGPGIAATGALATLLWMASARQAGIAVGPREFGRVGLCVAVPALAAGTLVVAVTARV